MLIVLLAPCLGTAILGAFYATEISAYLSFRSRFEHLGPNEFGLTEYRHRATGLLLVRIPAGRFMMGSPPDEEDREVDEIYHEVALSAFLIGKYEVSQDAWVKQMGVNPSARELPDLPVDNVSWGECGRFLDEVELLFPSEAQWEYACRAGTTTRFWSGNEESDLARTEWYAGSSNGRPQACGSRLPNPFGLYDMHGNVREFCADSYDGRFLTSEQASGPDPVCETLDAPGHVSRGGDYLESGYACRSAVRSEIFEEQRFEGLGFRVAYYPLPPGL